MNALKLNSKEGREIELKFAIDNEDSLNNRFKEIKDLKSDVVFSVDDDIIFPCRTVEFAFRVWQSALNAMVLFLRLDPRELVAWGGHTERRTECINQFVAEYGTWEPSASWTGGASESTYKVPCGGI